jgi:hypothetical protein
VEAEGYKNKSQWITLENGEEKRVAMELERIELPKIRRNPRPKNETKIAMPPISF